MNLLVEHANPGAQVVRTEVQAMPTGLCRLDEEIDAAGRPWHRLAHRAGDQRPCFLSCRVAHHRAALTKRGRNASVRFLTGQRLMNGGLPDHRLGALARRGEVAANL